MTDEAKSKNITLPVGRVINHSVFTRDQYNEQAKLSYKIELAFDPEDLEKINIEGLLCEAAVEKWGAAAADEYDGNKIVVPLHDGDEMAAKREAKGKAGDAYKGKLVIRADTIFNQDGHEGPGGIYVCGQDAKQITAVDQGKVYQGCYGKALVTIGAYPTSDGGKGLKFYLQGFQKWRDGERLVSQNAASAFKPVEGAQTKTSNRRRRASTE